MPFRVFRYLLALCLTGLAGSLSASDGVPVHQSDSEIRDQPTARSITVGSQAQLWPSGVIPYTLDPALPDASVLALTIAIAHWNKVGGISLIPLDDVEARIGTEVVDSVRITTGDYCASWVGRRGGQQNLWIAQNCPAGSIMHEIGHLLGLEHEHTRADRDQYIQIHWENITPEKHHNFDAAPDGSQLHGAYDYDSIMHYGTHNFSSNGEATITAIDGIARNIGQRVAPSVGDLQAIAELYGTDLSVMSDVAPSGSGSELEVIVSNLTNQGAHDISVVVSSTSDISDLPEQQGDWRCQRNEVQGATCKLAMLPASGMERLTLTLPVAQRSAGQDIDVTVSSTTPDDDLSNNSSTLQSDNVIVVAGSSPSEQMAVAIEEKIELKDDSVARVNVGSGGISVFALIALVLAVCIGRITAPGCKAGLSSG